MKRSILLFVILTVAISAAFSQIHNPVTWEFSSGELSPDTYELTFRLSLEDGWHVYGMNLEGEGPIPMGFYFDDNENIEFLTDISSSPEPEIKFDPTFEMDLELYGGKVTFKRNVKVTGKDALKLTGSIETQACTETMCLPPKEESFEFELLVVSAAATTEKDEEEAPAQESADAPDFTIRQIDMETKDGPSAPAEAEERVKEPVSGESTSNKKDSKDRSLFGLLLIGLAAGFGALFTPCVFPIIPLTVSFFMRNSTRSKAVFNGLIFGLSIVLIYTSVGLIAGVFRIDLMRLLSSHWLPNLLFFLLFVALAFSFFGLFEITLPSSWSNRIDQRADKGGILGPFFMALATVIISFSCTGLFAGAALGSAMQGEILQPVIGMLGFSISFALPFTLLAIFPGMLSKLPKSGGWLNAVKVFFAFVLLGSSLMFVTNLQLNFFTREIAIALLIVILFLLGIYLLGKIKFSHDSDVPHISIPRLLIAILIFALAVRLIPGLFGFPVNGIAPFVPQKSSYEKYFSQAGSSIPETAVLKSSICTDSPKYSDFLELPLNLKGYFDYEEALACAKELNKPVLLDFAGHSCKNCKKMYAEVWSDPAVLQKLSSEFVIAVLYTDDRTGIPEEDWVTSNLDGKIKKTLGKKFNNLQIEKFRSNALPLYAVVDPYGNILTEQEYYTYSPEIEAFIAFLDDGLENFKRSE